MKDLTLLAKIITNYNNIYNGHNQLDINYKFTFEELQPLIEELEKYYRSTGLTNTHVEARFWSDGSGSLELVGFWRTGEHVLGHKDKMLMSWGDS